MALPYSIVGGSPLDARSFLQEEKTISYSPIVAGFYSLTNMSNHNDLKKNHFKKYQTWLRKQETAMCFDTDPLIMFVENNTK